MPTDICNHRHKGYSNGSEITFICLKPKNHGGLHQGERKQCNWEIDNYYCVKSPDHIDDHKTIRMQIDEDKLKKRNTKFQDGDKVRTRNPNTIYSIQGCDVRVNGVWYYLQGWTRPVHEGELTLVETKENNDKVDPVNHPAHYTSDPSGIECITITRHRNFNIGNAIKYLWRAGLKDQDTLVQDLRKAVWYIEDEIKRIEK